MRKPQSVGVGDGAAAASGGGGGSAPDALGMSRGELWHRRFGHLGYSSLMKLARGDPGSAAAPRSIPWVIVI